MIFDHTPQYIDGPDCEENINEGAGDQSDIDFSKVLGFEENLLQDGI